MVARKRVRRVEVIAADIDEIDVDAVGRRGRETLQDRRGALVDALIGAE